MSNLFGPSQETDQQRAKGESSFLSQEERALVRRLMGSPSDIPREYIDWMIDAVAVNIPMIPISAIEGFQAYKNAVEAAQAAIEANQVIVRSSTITTEESTAVTAFGNLATEGPAVTGLAAGSYIVMFGAAAANSSSTANGAIMSIEIDAVTATNDDRAETFGAGTTSVMRAVAKTLSGGNSTVTAKYRAANGGTAQFGRRWVMTMKIGP